MNLGEFSEGSLLHTVRSRFTDAGKIYTQIGSAILVSVNPFRERKQLFSAKMAKMFQQESKKRKFNAGAQKDLDPHLFKVAEEAYQSMLESKKNQDIIISGISGSGKTEATKLMLAYLVNACNNFRNLDANQADLEQANLEGAFNDSVPEFNGVGSD